MAADQRSPSTPTLRQAIRLPAVSLARCVLLPPAGGLATGRPLACAAARLARAAGGSPVAARARATLGSARSFTLGAASFGCTLSCAGFLRRHFAAGLACFRKPDGDSLLAARHLLARAPALQRAALALAHGLFNLIAGFASVLRHENLLLNLFIRHTMTQQIVLR